MFDSQRSAAHCTTVRLASGGDELREHKEALTLSRTSSQKPGDEFIANFRQSFPEVAVATSAAGSHSESISLGEVTAGGPQPERFVFFFSMGTFMATSSQRSTASGVELSHLQRGHYLRWGYH